MPKLSPAREGVPLLQGLTCLSRGKVRDTYELPGFPDHLLVVVTDAVSIFDFVLNALVPLKGVILNALSHFWFQMLREYGFATHFVAAGSEIDRYLPEHLRGSADLQSRAMVVRRLEMNPVEFVFRGHLTGNGLKSYLQDGTVCGHRLPAGLHDGSRLPWILDTPTTKAQEGHDQALDAAEIRSRYPEATYVGLSIFQLIDYVARQHGIIFADTKFEFGGNVLGDEVATPDSSRFWLASEWEALQRSEAPKAPTPYDKQIVRAWGIQQGINDLEPANPEHVARVQSIVVPDEVLTSASAIYRYIFWRLADATIESYVRDKLGVVLPVPHKKVAVILGSESDRVHVTIPLAALENATDRGQISSLDLHVMSCHRHSVELLNWIQGGCEGADVVMAAGGMALALPGIIDAFTHAAGRNIPVIGVALGLPGTRDLDAAVLSIERLPGQPVIMDEIAGRPYIGEEGFTDALRRVAFGELPPPRPRKEKPAQHYVLSIRPRG